MEWLSLHATLFLFSSIIIASSSGDFGSGAIQAIRCMLLQSPAPDCSAIPEVPIPGYLTKVYNDGPESLHEALRNGQLAQLNNTELASLPLTLLYLIPRGRLSELSGAQLGTILRTHDNDTSIVHQITNSIQPKELAALIDQLKKSELSQDVIQILGEAINLEDIKHTLKSLSLMPALLAHLRPSVMYQVKDGFEVLVHLQGIQPPKIPKKEAIYPIALMAINSKFPLGRIDWLVSGLSPDDILNTSLVIPLSHEHFKLDLTSAQARAIFEKVYQNVTLTNADLMDCQPVLPKLTPSMLQRILPQGYNYNSLIKLQFPKSLATACQIQEYIRENCHLTGKLPKVEENELWRNRIHYLEKWVSTLPLTALEEYLSEPLKTASLKYMDRAPLSDLQIYYLTGRGESLNLEAHTSVTMTPNIFLRAIPASQLISFFNGNISSKLVEHLATFMPADNLPRTLAFLYRINLSHLPLPILEDLFENRDINIIMSLLSPKDLKEAAPDLLKWFKEQQGYSQTIRQLPQQVLAALLEHEQQSKDWSWQNLLDKMHVSHLLVGGLTCQHIEQMDVGIFIPIMAEYNRLHKPAFPRNLQICCLQKLVSFLKFKMAITQTDPSYGLISMLEPVEIESVGGYVLAGLPVEALRVSPYLGHILATIGKLSIAELILAANMSQLQSVAQLAVNKERTADVYNVYNLVWFLPPKTTISHFKLILQSGLLDTTLCLPQNLRRSLAIKLIAEFGPPESWTVGVLETLQDLLLVFTDEELGSVSKTVWTDAADTLTSHYGDNVDWINPMPFYQVCAGFLEESEEVEYKLAVRRLIRWRLQAAQWLLDTVEPRNHATSISTTSNIIVIDDIEVPMTPAKVFDPDLEESSTSESAKSTTEQSTTPVTGSETSTETTPKVETTPISTTTFPTITDTELNVVDNSESNTIEETTQSSTEKSKSTTIKMNSSEETSLAPFSKNNTGPDSPKNVSTVEGAKGNTSEHIVSYNNTGNEKQFFNKNNSESVVNVPNKEKNYANATNINVYTVPPKSIVPNFTQTTESQKSVNTSEMNSSDTHSYKNKTRIELPINEVNKNSSNSNKNVLPQTNRENKTITVPPSQETSNKTSAAKNNTLNVNDFSQSNGEIIEEDDDSNSNYESIFVDNTYTETSSVRSRRSIFTPEDIIKLSCNALRMVGHISGIALTEKDVRSMSDSEVEECRLEFGSMDLSPPIRNDLWKRISEEKKKEGIYLLGGLLQAAAVGDIWDLGPWKFNRPWVLETIHAFVKNNQLTVLKKLLQEVQSENPDELPPELLAVLGGYLCYLESDKLSSLDPPVTGFQPSNFCPPCLPFLARSAVKKLGPVSEWTQHYVYSLNYIVAGLELDDWKTLIESPLKPLSALQPAAITCLNSSHLEILSPEQIEMIPTLTLHALLPWHIKALSEAQIQALRKMTQLAVEDKLTPSRTVLVAGEPSSSSYLLASNFVIFTSLFYFVSQKSFVNEF